MDGLSESFKRFCPISLDLEGAKNQQPLVAQEVVVLAPNFKLSILEYNLLSKGLSFIPTNSLGKNQKLQLELDLQNYHRKIKLASYFRNAPAKKVTPFVDASTWTPPLELLPPQVTNLIHKDIRTFKKNYKFIKEVPNISLEEIKILKNLKSLKTIVIKPADKGSAIVILSRDQYILEAERQLNDPVYYEKLEKPIYLDTVPMIGKILDTLKKKEFINAKQRQYLGGLGQPRERRFYLLPKIHKDPKTWTVPFKIPPGRPIVSDCESETYRTTEYLDFYLNPISVKHPSYVKDTYDFIDSVKSLKIPFNSFFFSMDVDNLYTNIPIEDGISCVKKAFKMYPDPKRPDKELIELLTINLKRNDFVFNEKFYLQIKGTAMGKRFAPAYANIYMANWELEVLKKCKIKPFTYLRYLDDIWGIWTGSREEFDEFFGILNSHDPSIKLKLEINRETIEFLDTTVFKGPQFLETGKLDIKVFFKTTDTHTLLHKHSFHPIHTFKGIVKAQLLRFHRICTRREDFFGAVKILFKALLKRGYTRTFLKFCLKNFQNKKDKNVRNKIPLITTFSSTSRKLNWAWKNNFENILKPENIIPHLGTISAYRRNNNLKDWLVCAKLPSLTKKKPLGQQQFFKKLTFIRSNNNQLFKIHGEFDLNSFNCVYLISCLICNKKYVGETKNQLSYRLAQHIGNIKNKRDMGMPLIKHFIEHGLSNLKLSGLERNSNWTTWERKKRERFWIFILGTKEPMGLNLKQN